MLDIASLLDEVAAPPPELSDDLAQLRIADIGSLTADQVRRALHLIVEENPEPTRSWADAKPIYRKVPIRYLTYGALLSRTRTFHLYEQWGYRGLYLLARDELKVSGPLHFHAFILMYQRTRDFGFTPEEMEDMERRYPWNRVQMCAKYAANKSHFRLALGARRGLRRILYAGPGGKEHVAHTLGPFSLPRKRFLVIKKLSQWFNQEFQISSSESLIAMALITQAQLDKPLIERQRFLRTQLKELDINPKVADRFF